MTSSCLFLYSNNRVPGFYLWLGMQLLAVDKQLLIIFKNRQPCNIHISLCQRKGGNNTQEESGFVINAPERVSEIKVSLIRISEWQDHELIILEYITSILMSDMINRSQCTNIDIKYHSSVII